jgi:rhomboid protease GluP
VGDGVLLVLYVAGEYLPVAATARQGAHSPAARRWPVATVAALLVVGVPSAVQLTVAPSVLDRLERDRDAILAGEVWRLLTALVVQDGGTGGAVANLVALAVVGVVAEQVWSRRAWVAVALGGAFLAELWGLVVQPVGGGNSVAVFALAASLAMVASMRGDLVARVLAGAALAAGAVLLVTGDLHGGAVLAGALLGLRLSRTGEPR